METKTELTKEQEFVSNLNVFNWEQLREFTDAVIPKSERELRSYHDIWSIPDNCKSIYDHIQSTLPAIRKIKSTEQIQIGDVLIYTMEPKGTGMFKPKVGTRWEMKTDDDILDASIEIIERRRGWWPIDKTKTTTPNDLH